MGYGLGYSESGQGKTSMRSDMRSEEDGLDESFWQKVIGSTLLIGKQVLEKALWLHYAAQSPSTPATAKAVIYTALGYFLSPVDAIPDITPLAGYTDDLIMLATAVAVIAMHIDENVKQKTKQKLKNWFGE